MTAIKSEYHLDESTGQRYVLSKPGGTTNDNGDEAGLFVGEIPDLAVSGIVSNYPCVANAAIDSGSNAIEFITNATGYKGFTLDINAASITAGQVVMVCWSTEVNGESNTTDTLNALRVALGVPDGVARANTLVITPLTKEIPAILWDGVDRIKTISIASQATTNYNVAIRTAE